jgi:hypothetical protein
VDDLLIGQPSTFNHVRDPNRAGCIGDGGFDVLCAADFLTVDANNDIARPEPIRAAGELERTELTANPLSDGLPSAPN